ncbi:MAG TPA: hypothetical protein VKK19_05545 [Candidatus Dormibacteraeota bacterium]|nr:hypothetical protein [Candidatus Dormibacteraeota bacterium]
MSRTIAGMTAVIMSDSVATVRTMSVRPIVNLPEGPVRTALQPVELVGGDSGVAGWPIGPG